MSYQQKLSQKMKRMAMMALEVKAADREDDKERVAQGILEGEFRVEEEQTSFVNSSSFVTPQWPVLEEKALVGLAGDFVETVGPHSEADPAALLMQLLAWFGNAVGSSPFYQVEGDRHHCNLYVVVVGDTSRSRKGTSEGQVRRLFESTDPR